MAIPKKTKRFLTKTGDKSKTSFRTKTTSFFASQKGLNANLIKEISRQKSEPKWMLDFRLRAYEVFLTKKMPNWGADLAGIDFNRQRF